MANNQFGAGDRTAEAIANMNRKADQEARRQAGERQERAAKAAGRDTRKV